MRNLQEYGLWLVLVTINAVIVSQWVNYLINMSSEAAGFAAGSADGSGRRPLRAVQSTSPLPTRSV